MRLSGMCFSAVLSCIVVLTVHAADQTDDPFPQARSAHVAGKFGDAVKLYRQVTDARRIEVARSYEADALARMGKVEEATAAYTALLAVTEYQAYRGEAMLELARLLCTQPSHAEALKQAQRHLLDAMLWHEAAGSSADRAADAPAVHPGLVHAGTSIDGQSLPWYRPALKAETLRLHVFVLTCIGDQQGARQALERLRAAEAALPAILRIDLRDLASGVERGSFVVPLLVWQSLSEQHQAALRMGYFQVASGFHAEAELLLKDVHSQVAAGAGHANDWAASEIGLAICEFRRGDRTSAVKRLDQFQNILRGSASSRYGRLVLANIHASDRKNYNQAIRLYGDLCSEVGDSPSQAQAMLAMMIAAANHGDGSTCYRTIDQLRSKYPDHPEAKIADKVLEAMSPAAPGSDSKQPVRPVPGLQRDAWTISTMRGPLLLPGGTVDMTGNRSAGGSGDTAGGASGGDLSASFPRVLVIDIDTEPQTGNVLPTGLRLFLPPDHPQLPSVAQTKLYVVQYQE